MSCCFPWVLSLLIWFEGLQIQCNELIFTLQIGSSPGFEDGEFESAKLLHPAASFYHAAEDCLYIVDSEVIIHNGLPQFTRFDKYVLFTGY